MCDDFRILRDVSESVDKKSPENASSWHFELLITHLLRWLNFLLLNSPFAKMLLEMLRPCHAVTVDPVIVPFLLISNMILGGEAISLLAIVSLLDTKC